MNFKAFLKGPFNIKGGLKANFNGFTVGWLQPFRQDALPKA
jgi:hypothetical protein